jgi:hypothetical protein
MNLEKCISLGILVLVYGACPEEELAGCGEKIDRYVKEVMESERGAEG